MLGIVLYQPEIPPNTGNIIRLSANTGTELHLIHPLGFALSDKQLKRAGLDYHEWARVKEHACFGNFRKSMRGEQRLLAFSTRGNLNYHEVAYSPNDLLLFGSETQGLGSAMLSDIPPENTVRIPMLGASRSLNLSNAVAVVVYEALRQMGFEGLGFL